MVEGARLESVYTRKGIAGSNPALSAINFEVRLSYGGSVGSLATIVCKSRQGRKAATVVNDSGAGM